MEPVGDESIKITEASVNYEFRKKTNATIAQTGTKMEGKNIFMYYSESIYKLYNWLLKRIYLPHTRHEKQ